VGKWRGFSEDEARQILFSAYAEGIPSSHRAPLRNGFRRRLIARYSAPPDGRTILTRSAPFCPPGRRQHHVNPTPATDSLLRQAKKRCRGLAPTTWPTFCCISWPAPSVPEQLESLSVVRRARLARHVGFSNYPLDRLAAALSTAFPKPYEYGPSTYLNVNVPQLRAVEAVAAPTFGTFAPVCCEDLSPNEIVESDWRRRSRATYARTSGTSSSRRRGHPANLRRCP